MPSNRAAWLTAEKAKPLEIKPAPYMSAGENEIVVKNAALAINPIDWKMQDTARYPLNYPAVLGQDVAGEVVEVGSSVSRFSKGDRVLGHAVGLATKRNCDCGFQEYTVLLANMASQIPSTLSFESAAVLPLALSTAASGLFQKGCLELEYPSLNPKSTGKTVLIWGCSSSVGSNAIQLAVAAGCDVITTASPRNFDYVKKLGASQVFDYNSSTIVDDLVDAFKGKTIGGALDPISAGGSFKSCVDVLDKSEGKKVVAMTAKTGDELPSGVSASSIFGSNIKDNEVSRAVYEDFLPKALAEGKFVAAPEPHIIGKGLKSLQEGLEVQRRGMSAKKVVVIL
jgi:NADPH:quinone reductase-like Zn-dependent oxidoreductase